MADERDPGLPDPAGEGGRPGRPSPFARIAVDVTPLRTSRDFRRLWVGQGVSFLVDTSSPAGRRGCAGRGSA